MQATQITIYGYGYVGKAVANFLKDIYSLEIVDPNQMIPTEFKSAKLGEATSRHAIICLPTNMNPDGTCDTSIVENVTSQTNHEFYLLKSTVPPGTTKRLAENTGKKIAMSPEYIGEGKYQVQWWKNHPHPTDMKLHSFHIFGGVREATKEWVDIYLPVTGPSVQFVQTDSTTAEFVKYTENIWGAMKVTWANEMFEASEKMGVDWREIRELWALDGRTEKMHTAIFVNKRGWAGKCFPKDLIAFIKLCQSKGYQPEMLKEIVKSNARFSANPDLKALPEKL